MPRDAWSRGCSRWTRNSATSPDQTLIKVVHRSVGRGGTDEFGSAPATGSQVGNVTVELVDTVHRELTGYEIAALWRRQVGSDPGCGYSKLRSSVVRSRWNTDRIQAARRRRSGSRPGSGGREQCKQKLATYPGVFDIEDDSRPGKWEYRIRVKDKAQSLGVTTADVANTIRSAYYGAEVMRLQRGRHEVKLMVRYPARDRHSLAEFQQIYIRTADGQERPADGSCRD